MNKYRIIRFAIVLFFTLFLTFQYFGVAHAATLSMDPSGGTFVVGSTFEVPIFVNTENEPVNAIQISAKFPADKLQLISPSTGKSIITLWTEQPSYDNQAGLVSIQGVIPNGITTGKGLVTTMSFRVKAPGDAYLKFFDKTRVLKHDGLGTDVLRQTSGAVYRLILPPPAGPIVASQTHPDPYAIYRTNDVFLSWAPEDSLVSSYSYILNDSPVDIPDDISEGTSTTLLYRDLLDGKHFFHIKGYRFGSWGGVTNFALNIDTSLPAEFPVTLLPDTQVDTGRQVIVQFSTTDSTSGIDHYELKLVSLSHERESAPQESVLGSQPLFIEATSPYILEGFQETGKYAVIVRAFDKAGNYRESTGILEIAHPTFGVIHKDGLGLSGHFIIPWWLVILILLLILALLVVLALRIRRRHTEIEERLRASQLPGIVASQAQDLAEKQKQYVNITQLVLGTLFVASGIFGALPANGGVVAIDPPLVTTLSRNIGNDEIFYVGGTTAFSGAHIIVYLQNSRTGETFSQEAEVNQKGEWFYRHNGFLAAGDYILWAQESLGGQMSPPSPQEQLVVTRTALQFGTSRLSYEFIYGIIALVLSVLVVILLLFIAYHNRQARIKHARWVKEVGEASEAIRTGFAVLKRDILAELDVVRRAKMTDTLRAEEVGKEEQLLKDLAWVESNITKEVVDIEKEL